MNQTCERALTSRSWVEDKLLLGLSPREYLRGLRSVFNLVALGILAVGVPIVAYRFAQGLGAVTNLSQTNPWGLWIGLDVLTGVALAAGGYVLAATVYLFGLKRYYPVLRAAVLTGFLGYFFVVVGLLVDLGQPWRLPYPLVVSYGVTSVMFLVAWHVFLYLTVQFLEFCPAVFEWLGCRRLRWAAAYLTIGATVFGVILSTLHQSALGALFLLAPAKLHPLWYSPFIPVFFFVSSIAAGLSMVIVESTLSHGIFHNQLDPDQPVDLEGITFGLGRAASVVLFTLFFLRLLGLADGNQWHLLGTPLGRWYLVEVVGLVLVPCFLFAYGVRHADLRVVRTAAVVTVIGIVVNRLNVSVVAMNWNVADRYFPSWMELWTSLTIITVGVLTFRWIVNRMPVLYEHPDYVGTH